MRSPVLGGIGMWLTIKVAALAAVFLLFSGSEPGSPGSTELASAEAALSTFGSDPVRLDYRP